MALHNFRIGEPVWALAKGYPWWPAHIIEPSVGILRQLIPHDLIPNNNPLAALAEDEFIVRYFNDRDNIALQPTDTLRPLSEAGVYLSYDGHYKEGVRTAYKLALEHGIKEGFCVPPNIAGETRQRNKRKRKEVKSSSGTERAKKPKQSKRFSCEGESTSEEERTLDTVAVGAADVNKRGAQYSKMSREDLLVVAYSRTLELTAFKKLANLSPTDQEKQVDDTGVYLLLPTVALRDIILRLDEQLLKYKSHGDASS